METRISRSLLSQIHAAAAAAAPREACGLLFGDGAAITGWEQAENVAPHPDTHFEIAPAALIAALRAERAGARSIAGYWHSHPGGVCAPSRTDAESAAGDGRLWLIVANGVAGLWRAQPDVPPERRFARVRLVETDGARAPVRS